MYTLIRAIDIKINMITKVDYKVKFLKCTKRYIINIQQK